jgi:two-component system phosphate regulon sensor histidine kinase PhoR
MAFSELEPLQIRVDSLVLDSLIGRSLSENGINLAHAYGVTGYGADTLTIARPADFRAELAASPFRTSLFPHDIFAQPTDLVLYFPDHRTYLWGEIAPMLTASIVLTLIIIGCFAYTIRTIFAQRRFSGRLVDFINNMTHEFKTPISTVALAAEAIDRPEVVDNREKVLRFNEMIRTENRRMRTQVDKILQMAVLEEGDYDLEKEPVDLHEVIEQAAAGFALKVESRGGRMQTSLEASNATVYGDAVHLTNIIYNLLDNANKYTPESPRITVRTRNHANGIEIAVADNGIGIKTEDREYVFDKYFRVPSGNVHDVKGFGIGLSYVKMMVRAHGGSIRLDSEVGTGTTVTLSLPTASNDRG